MTRALATLRRIKDILPIEGADLIVLAIVDGWQVVVGKDEFKVGDLGVYYEIDSFLNGDDPRYAFAEERFIDWEGKRGMRLKTIKLRKQLSQGLIMPLAKFPEIVNPTEGQDVTELLKIEKWERADEARENSGGSFAAAGSKRRDFPFFIPKTDQPRVQNMSNQLYRMLDEEFEVTIKKDGSSGTFFKLYPNNEYYDEAQKILNGKMSLSQRVWAWVKKNVLRQQGNQDPIVGICSRNVWLKREGDSNFHKAAEIAGIENIDTGASLALQGEVISSNIQDNYEKVEEGVTEFHLFDIHDIDAGQDLLPRDRWRIAKELGIPHVTVLYVGTLRSFIDYKEGDNILEKLLALAEGPSDNPKVKREGIVLKSMVRNFSMKVVSNSYLLKKG